MTKAEQIRQAKHRGDVKALRALRDVTWVAPPISTEPLPYWDNKAGSEIAHEETPDVQEILDDTKA